MLNERSAISTFICACTLLVFSGCTDSESASPLIIGAVVIGVALVLFLKRGNAQPSAAEVSLESAAASAAADNEISGIEPEESKSIGEVLDDMERPSATEEISAFFIDQHPDHTDENILPIDAPPEPTEEETEIAFYDEAPPPLPERPAAPTAAAGPEDSSDAAPSDNPDAGSD